MCTWILVTDSLSCPVKMLWLVFLAAFLQCTISQQYQQKVAPGVPPQQYQGYQQTPPQHGGHQQQAQQGYQQPGYQQPIQQQMPPQQMQQQQMPPQQMQQQQMPPQQQQMPPQQVQQQQMPPQQMQQQQMPPQQVQQQHAPHGSHGSHGGDPQLLNPTNIAHEREHIQEHMDVPIDTSKMSDQELQFHYFKMHDADNNNKLDGCELIKSLIHWHEQGHKQEAQGSPPVGEKIFADDELINLIDPILNMDDHNRDGFIDYPEFVRAQQKSQAQPQEKP